MSLDMRLVAYAPNGARLGPLPTPQTVQAAMPFGDVGGIEVAYPKAGAKASLLATPCEIALEVSYDDGATWSEPADSRYLRLVRKGDTVETPELRTYSGPSYVWRLTKARVLPEGLLNADGKRPFLSATPGTILRTLAQEAQARGALAGMDFTTFDGDNDSDGTPWAQVVTLYYEPGLDYLTILLNLQAQGLCDFTMAERSLRVYNGDTVMAGASGATLLKGRDLTEAPYTGTLEGLADFVYLAGDEGASFSRTNGAATAPWGRWETYISQGGVKDEGTMTVLTDSALELSADERVENTYGLAFGAAKALPFRDYGLGQTIAVRDGEALPVDLRCRQITLTRDERGLIAGNVVLNDRFLENEVRQTRRVQGITGGSTADGGTGARPAPTGTDKIAPKAPTGLTFASDAYLDDEGKVWSTVTVNWVAPTENADSTALTDLAGYEVYWRLSGDATWTLATITDDDSATIGGYYPNTQYEFAVRALDDTGNRSVFSAAETVLTDDDATNPGKPSAPVVTPYLGQLLLEWDGLLDGGGALPNDFARAEFHLSSVNGFAPSAATLVDQSTAKGGASTVATGLVYGTTYYAKIVLYDRSGNVSVPSNQATGVPAKAAAGDISSITANQITAGALLAAITVSGRIATALTGARVELNSAGLKAYNASGVLTVDIPSDGSGPTFTGTLRTGTTGARTEIVPGAAGAIIRLYSGMTSETSPGTIETILDGTGAAADARMRLTAPAKNSLPPAWLELRSRDADSGADMLVDVKNGSFYWLSEFPYGKHIFANNTAGTVVDWLQIYRFDDGWPNPGSAVITAKNNLLLTTAPNRAVKIVGIMDHSGGQMKMSDEYGQWRWISGNDGRADAPSYIQSEVAYNRTYTSTANMFITSSFVVGRTTSSERYKVALDRQWADSVDLAAVKALTPTSYYDKAEAEAYARLCDGEDVEDAPFPRRLLGLIAEDVAAIKGLAELTMYGEDGEPNGVAYDRVAVALIPWLHQIDARLDALEADLRPVDSPA